jgi:hypothetical protein
VRGLRRDIRWVVLRVCLCKRLSTGMEEDERAGSRMWNVEFVDSRSTNEGE